MSSEATDSDEKKSKNDLSDAYKTMISGTAAAICGTYIKQPIQRVKWLKQVAEHASKLEGRSVFRVFEGIYTKEGVTGLWRGSISTIIRNVPHASLVYTIYPLYYAHFESIPIDLSKSENANAWIWPFYRMAIGSMASVSGTLITHPLDTVRVRMATQWDNLAYKSEMQTIKAIIREERVIALYRGLLVTLIGTIFRGGIGFGMYETLKSDSMKSWSTSVHNEIGRRLLNGAITGVTTTFLCYPIDTIRRRQQVFGSHRKLSAVEVSEFGGEFRMHTHALDSIRWIWRNEGLFGFYKGLSLGLIKSPMAIGVSFTVNDIVKRMLGWGDS